MFIGKVTGHVVSSQHEPAMAGVKLVVVEAHTGAGPAADALAPTGRFVAAADSLGAAVGEYVLVTQGSSARLTAATQKLPVDAVVVGIVDAVRLHERVYARADGTLR
ncbi:MAG: ethanolamine utilization protein EutN [Planctomycetes bacterium]|nr:ethanolamine utilization protein EutN [Planctomycetota bacterium]